VGHIPHLYLPPPWPPTAVPLPATAAHHLVKVLRLDPGAAVTYTDGAGRHGEGHLRDGTVVRGDEHTVPPPAIAITMAVAPPHDKDRLRFMIEKLAELEVGRVRFLRTRFGAGRLPDLSKSIAWATGALEQSQGAWLMDITTAWTEPASLDPVTSWYAERDGAEQVGPLPAEATIAIGPEGGWAPGEIPENAQRLGLGRTVLRVETAAIVAAGIFRRQGSVIGPFPSQEKTV
jgi:16S rRNA (uracil1498-N3)-methyltransferase